MLDFTIELDVYLPVPGKGSYEPGATVIDPREIKRIEEVVGVVTIVMNNDERFVCNSNRWAVEAVIKRGFEKIREDQEEREIRAMERELDRRG